MLVTERRQTIRLPKISKTLTKIIRTVRHEKTVELPLTEGGLFDGV